MLPLLTIPYNGCDSLAEALVSFVARNGLELLAVLDEDKYALRRAAAS